MDYQIIPIPGAFVAVSADGTSAYRVALSAKTDAPPNEGDNAFNLRVEFRERVDPAVVAVGLHTSTH